MLEWLTDACDEFIFKEKAEKMVVELKAKFTASWQISRKKRKPLIHYCSVFNNFNIESDNWVVCWKILLNTKVERIKDIQTIDCITIQFMKKSGYVFDKMQI